MELIVFITHYLYAKKKMNIDIQIFTKKNSMYIILSLMFIPISLLIKKMELGFYITMMVIIISCVFLYCVVLYIIKDNNLIFIFDKFKNKLKVGKR